LKITRSQKEIDQKIEEICENKNNFTTIDEMGDSSLATVFDWWSAKNTLEEFVKWLTDSSS